MKSPSAQPAKGTRDVLPDLLRKRRHAEGVIRRVYEAHGFEPLETPALERLDALSGKYGEEGDQLMFKVLLRGQPLVRGIRAAAEHLQEPAAVVQGRSGETAPGAPALLADLGLRYDLTVPLARAYAAHRAELPSVFKRYQIQPVWRADTPGRGRYREFRQCDVDVVGSRSPLVEAEVATAAVECLEALGFRRFELRVNHRGLLRAIVECAGCPNEREVEAIVALDKLDKIGAEGVRRELAARSLPGDAAEKLVELVTAAPDLAAVESFVQSHEKGREAVGELRRVLELCGGTLAESRLAFDVSLARGLGYYTGCIFEMSSPDFSGSLGGGGRYDDLIGTFLGRSVPACGFALGFERLVLLMEEFELFPPGLSGAEVSLAAAETGSEAALLELGRKLRSTGLGVATHPEPQKFGKLRKSAAERGARFAVWLEGGRLSYWQRDLDRIERDVTVESLIALVAASGS